MVHVIVAVPFEFGVATTFVMTGGGGGGGGGMVNCNGADDVAGEVLLLLDASFDVTRK